MRVPDLGDCELQKLGVEYDITDNDLVVKGGRVRIVEPQHEHPFIRRDMDRCIACGRCVRVCRDVAGPACYDFTGRGFTINVDTALRRRPAGRRLHHVRPLRDRVPDRRASRSTSAC